MSVASRHLGEPRRDDRIWQIASLFGTYDITYMEHRVVGIQPRQRRVSGIHLRCPLPSVRRLPSQCRMSPTRTYFCQGKEDHELIIR